MTNLEKQFAELEPVRSFEELTSLAQNVLGDAYRETYTRKREPDAAALITYLEPIYLKVPDADAIKAAQFAALHFLYCLENIICDWRDEVFYKRDDLKRWHQLSFDDLASGAGFSAWESDATYYAMYGDHQIGEYLDAGIFHVMEKVFNDYDAAGVLVTSEKPDDFEE